MTTIEELWESAQTDPELKKIRDILADSLVFICNDCGGECELDGKTGRHTCKDCGCNTYCDS